MRALQCKLMPPRGKKNLTKSSESRRPGSKKFGSHIFIKEEHLVISRLNYEKEAALRRKTEGAAVFSFTA